MIKALVLNLESETERMAFQEKQLTKLGIPFRRLPAKIPTDIEPPSDSDFWKRWERPLKEVEKAILLTHLAAWKSVISANEPMLILEDDAWLSSKTTDFLAKIYAIPNLDHVTLEVRGRKKIISNKPHDDSDELYRLYQDRSGAAAYVLWPEGARKLIDRTNRCAGLADAMICAAYDLSSWQAVPPLAIQLDQTSFYGLDAPLKTKSSVIEGAEKNIRPKKNLAATLRRLKSQLRMGLRQVSTLGIASKRFLKPKL